MDIATKKIIALSGVSGVGKTHKRTTDPALKDLPFLDIADIYAEYPNLGSKKVFAHMMFRMKEVLTKEDTVVLEASFLKLSTQRAWLSMWADELNAEVEYIELTASKKVLLERVEADYRKGRHLPTPTEREEARRFYEARIKFINSVEFS